jgi:hypothetical protein
MVGGKRRIFDFFESAPIKALCKPLKTEYFPLSLSLKNSKKPKTWFDWITTTAPNERRVNLSLQRPRLGTRGAANEDYRL